MKRADVKVGESYERAITSRTTDRVVVVRAAEWTKRVYSPGGGFTGHNAAARGFVVTTNDGREVKVESRDLLRPWAEAEAERARNRDNAAKHAAALRDRRARWGDIVERLAPLAAGARASSSRRALVLRITDPEHARRVLAALEPAAAGEETTP